MRRVALMVVLLAVLAGCGEARPETQPETQLTIVALNSSVGRAEFQLECSPAGGDVPDPGKACSALAAEPELVTAPKPFTCLGGDFSWWDVTITGRLDGKPIRRNFSSCWTPQMGMIGRFGLSWDVLENHLVPRRHEAVPAGSSRVFAPGVLRRTDLVSCDILGHHFEMGVPLYTDQPGSVGFGGANVVSVTLEVTRESDGSSARVAIATSRRTQAWAHGKCVNVVA